jgi:hypothetical protein
MVGAIAGRIRSRSNGQSSKIAAAASALAS